MQKCVWTKICKSVFELKYAKVCLNNLFIRIFYINLHKKVLFCWNAVSKEVRLWAGALHKYLKQEVYHQVVVLESRMVVNQVHAQQHRATFVKDINCLYVFISKHVMKCNVAWWCNIHIAESWMFYKHSAKGPFIEVSCKYNNVVWLTETLD